MSKALTSYDNAVLPYAKSQVVNMRKVNFRCELRGIFLPSSPAIIVGASFGPTCFFLAIKVERLPFEILQALCQIGFNCFIFEKRKQISALQKFNDHPEGSCAFICREMQTISHEEISLVAI